MTSTLQSLGKYEIREELGRGAFATVYRALDMPLDREVALKVLHPPLLTDPSFIARFQREAQTMAKLDHPHIAAVYEVGETAGRVYIALYLARGSNLSDALAQEGRFSWAQTLEILQPICAALDYAHGRGVVHRDLKPANILLDSEHGPMLTDFGFARLMGDSSVSLSLSGGILGTPAYIAPEVWELDASTPAADIYALGCIACEMLTGATLFAGKTPMQAMRAHDQGPQFAGAWPEGTPAGIEAVLSKALARDPAARYSSAAALWHALRSLEAQAQATKEAAKQAAVAAQWQVETEAALAAGEWSAAKMAAARWLALAPGNAAAQAALRRAETALAEAARQQREAEAAARERLEAEKRRAAREAAQRQAAAVAREQQRLQAEADSQRAAQAATQRQQREVGQATATKTESSTPLARSAIMSAPRTTGVDKPSAKTISPKEWLWSHKTLIGVVGIGLLLVLASGGVFSGGGRGASIKPTETPIMAQTHMSQPTATRTATPTHTPQPTATPTHTPRPTTTLTATPTHTPSPTASSTPTPTFSPTPSPTTIPVAIHGFSVQQLEPGRLIELHVDVSQYIYSNPQFESGYIAVSVQPLFQKLEACTETYCVNLMSCWYFEGGTECVRGPIYDLSTPAYGRGVKRVWVGCNKNFTGAPVQTDQFLISLQRCVSGRCNVLLSSVFNYEMNWTNCR